MPTQERMQMAHLHRIQRGMQGCGVLLQRWGAGLPFFDVASREKVKRVES
jgi:hypothetical protein